MEPLGCPDSSGVPLIRGEAAEESDDVASCGLVSVVIPAFNRAHMISDALDSVFEQTFRPIELVVVDDGSVDDTEVVVRAWMERRAADDFAVRYLRQDNMGGNVARNRGIAASSGGVIAFLDSDDLWCPEKLSLQLSVFSRCPELGAVYCGIEHVNYETAQSSAVAPRSYPSGWIGEQLLVFDVTAPTSTYIVRREVFKTCGVFDEELRARQDWDMWIRVSEYFAIGCVPRPLVKYRNHNGARTISDPTRELVAYRRILEKNHSRLKNAPFVVRRQAYAAYHRRSARVSFHCGLSRPEALRQILLSIVHWPLDFDTYAVLLGMVMTRRLRAFIRDRWNSVFGATAFAIRSH